MKVGGAGEEARPVMCECQNSFFRNDTSGARQRNSVMLLFLVHVRGCGKACSACTLLISAWFLGRLCFFLPLALFQAVGAVGCKISPLIVKQRGAKEAEPLLGVFAPYGRG